MSDNDNDNEKSSQHEEEKNSHKSDEEGKEKESENEKNNDQDSQGEEGQENEKNQESEKEEIKIPFLYFEDINNDIQDDSIFENMIGQFKYSICILMKDDSPNSSQLLYYTLKGIYLNLKELDEKAGIKSEQISIFIFVNNLLDEYLFKEEEKEKLEDDIENKTKFLMRERTFNEDNELKNSKYYTIANNDYLYDVRAL